MNAKHPIKEALSVAIKALEQEPILDKIRAEIELEKLGYPPSAGYYKAIMKCLQIIDKCKGEGETKMKIHDKFVIELAEVIKGYSNDYRTHDPFYMPCDYKFYEISGVAICEESFSKMKPLSDEIDAVLDKIRDEIAEYKDDKLIHAERNEMIDIVLEIIDKYKEESEDI